MGTDATSMVAHARRKHAALLALSSRLGRALRAIVESALNFYPLPKDRGHGRSQSSCLP
jgi:hypothetical protein